MSHPLEEFRTQDTALAGFLIGAKFDLLRAEIGERIQFVFPMTESLRTALADYTMNRPAPVQDVISGYRHAVNIVRDGRREFFNSKQQTRKPTNQNEHHPIY